LSQRDNLVEQETLVIAWAQVARVCDAGELNIALISLVEYLGHPNLLICAVAHSEAIHLAEDLNRTPMEMFKPFWRTMSVVVVRDLLSRPQKAQQLCDLLGISVNQLLLLTQHEAIPYLILTRKREVLQRIAAARGPGVGVQDICMQPRKHIASIIAMLLLQKSPDVEKTTMELLCDAAPGFSETDLSTLVRLEPVQIACEILKVASQGSGGNRVHVGHC